MGGVTEREREAYGLFFFGWNRTVLRERVDERVVLSALGSAHSTRYLGCSLFSPKDDCHDGMTTSHPSLYYTQVRTGFDGGLEFRLRLWSNGHGMSGRVYLFLFIYTSLVRRF